MKRRKTGGNITSETAEEEANGDSDEGTGAAEPDGNEDDYYDVTE